MAKPQLRQLRQPRHSILGPRTCLVYLATLTFSLWLFVEGASLQWVASSYSLILTVIGINVIGLIGAYIVTEVLEFPTDGGYRDPVIRAEFGQDEHSKGTQSAAPQPPIKN